MRYRLIDKDQKTQKEEIAIKMCKHKYFFVVLLNSDNSMGWNVDEKGT